MRCYLNDTSLQGQFKDQSTFEKSLREMLDARRSNDQLNRMFFTTRSVGSRIVLGEITFKRAMQTTSDVELKRRVLAWLDKNGPFIEDDSLLEEDNFFECLGENVTDAGLGEAARRIKSGDPATSFSFAGGTPNFAVSPLQVEHGLPEDRLGSYAITNHWSVVDLLGALVDEMALPTTWRMLVEYSRAKFPHLILPNAIFENAQLSREPFNAAIRDRTLVLLGYLNRYVADRNEDGAEGPDARVVLQEVFVGEKAPFTGESPTNRIVFKKEMTFPDPDGHGEIFAHWHGKINQKVFRLHFEWPIPVKQRRLKVLYLGPKITKG